MTGAKLTLCRRCASALIKPQSRFAQRRPFFTTRSSTQIPVLKIPAPQTTAPPAPPPPPPPIRHDPGLELGQNGIPVPPPPGERRRGSQEERAWTETVFRTLSGGMKSEYLKCTELDENGNVRVGMQAFKKMELCTMHGLLPRDLRKLEVGTPASSPSILVRKNSILVNLLHIRALVKADKVLVFDVMAGADSHAQSIFMWDLEGKLRQGSKAMGGLPYELRALESILISVSTALDVEMAVLRKFVNELLTQLEEDIDRERLRNMLVYSKKLSAFEKKATLTRDAVAEILDNDEDLAGMYLTEKSRGKQRDVDQHDEVELLLEAYVKQIDGIVQEADQLVSNMRNTEEIVNIILDANRNSLMLLDLKVSMTTLGIGSGAAIAGLLGMNIKNFLENWEYGFPVVTSVALGTSALICIIGLTRLRKIQKLTLYGRYPGSKKTEMNPWDMGDRGYDKGEVERLKELKKLKWRVWWGVGRRRDDVERERVKWWKRLWKVSAHR